MVNYIKQEPTLISILQSKICRAILKVTLSLVLMTTVSASFAQSYQTEVAIIQEAFGLEKKLAIANFMKLDDSAKGFWKIYDEYEVARKALGNERIEIIAAYAESYPNISDEQILTLFKRREKMVNSMEKLQRTYFKRMSKEVGINKAAQFWQLESYFNVIIQSEIYSQIPFIGENLKKE